MRDTGWPTANLSAAAMKGRTGAFIWETFVTMTAHRHIQQDIADECNLQTGDLPAPWRRFTVGCVRLRCHLRRLQRRQQRRDAGGPQRDVSLAALPAERLDRVRGIVADAINRKQDDVRPARQAGQAGSGDFPPRRHGAGSRPQPLDRGPHRGNLVRPATDIKQHDAVQPDFGAMPGLQAGISRATPRSHRVPRRIASRSRSASIRADRSRATVGLRRGQPFLQRRAAARLGGQAPFQVDHHTAQRALRPPACLAVRRRSAAVKASRSSPGSACRAHHGLMQRLLLALHFRLQRRLFRFQQHNRLISARFADPTRCDSICTSPKASRMIVWLVSGCVSVAQ